MLLSWLRKDPKQTSKSPRRRSSSGLRTAVRPALEQLEDRWLLSTVMYFSGRGVLSTEGIGFTENAVADFSAQIDRRSVTSASGFNAEINWGDGQSSGGDFQNDDPNSPRFVIRGSHTYEEVGQYPIRVSVTAPDGTSAEGRSNAIVRNAPFTGIAKLVRATAGETFTAVVATIIDTNPKGKESDFAATIYWDGNEHTEGRIRANDAGGFDVIGTWTFDRVVTTCHIQVVISDIAGGGTRVCSRVSLSEPSQVQVLKGGVSMTNIQGQEVNGPLATFDDPSTPPTLLEVEIDWGDESPPDAGNITPTGAPHYQVDGGPHTYSKPGPYTITITLRDPQSRTSTATADVQVVAPPQTSGTHLALIAGQSSGEVVVANFTPSPGGSGPSSATIQWGDNSAPVQGIVRANGQGTYDIQGTHTYSNSGRHAITVTITDPDGAVPPVQSTADVADAPPDGQCSENLRNSAQPASNAQGVVAASVAAKEHHLILQPVSTSQIDVSWTPVEGAVGYAFTAC